MCFHVVSPRYTLPCADHKFILPPPSPLFFSSNALLLYHDSKFHLLTDGEKDKKKVLGHDYGRQRLNFCHWTKKKKRWTTGDRRRHYIQLWRNNEAFVVGMILRRIQLSENINNFHPPGTFPPCRMSSIVINPIILTSQGYNANATPKRRITDDWLSTV